MRRADRVRAPGGPVAEARQAIRRLGPRRAARAWGLRERELLILAAGAPTTRATILEVMRRQLAEIEATS